MGCFTYSCAENQSSIQEIRGRESELIAHSGIVQSEVLLDDLFASY